MCKELSITAEEAQLAATAVSSAKNCLRRRCGHSPHAWIFGREGRAIEDVLDPDSGGRVSYDISDDAHFQRLAAIRASARVAFTNQRMMRNCAKPSFSEQEPRPAPSRTASRYIIGICRKTGGRDAGRVQA